MCQTTETLEKVIHNISKESLPSKQTSLENSPTTSSYDVPSVSENKGHVEAQFIRCDDNFILLNIPAGKPNRRAKTEGDAKRVPQTIKGLNTCVYYACKMHAMLQTDYLEKQNTAARKTASSYRKSLTKWQAKYIFILSCLKKCVTGFQEMKHVLDAGNHHFREDLRESELERDYKEKSEREANRILQETIVKKKIIELLHSYCPKVLVDLNQKALTDALKAEPVAEIWRSFINAYQASKEIDILKFIEHMNQEQEVAIAISFLAALHKDVETICRHKLALLLSKFKGKLPEHYAAALLKKDSLAALPLIARHSFLRHVVNSVLIEEVFNLKPNLWKPEDGFDSLFRLFQLEKRPLIIGGFFGESYYEEPAKIISTFDSCYEVRGWRENARPNLVSDTAEYPHEIVIIGLEKNNGANGGAGYVYYVDPVDLSDPEKNDAKRTVYKISYEEFVRFVKDNSGFVHQGLEEATGRRVLIPARLSTLDYGYS